MSSVTERVSIRARGLTGCKSLLLRKRRTACAARLGRDVELEADALAAASHFHGVLDSLDAIHIARQLQGPAARFV